MPIVDNGGMIRKERLDSWVGWIDQEIMTSVRQSRFIQSRIPAHFEVEDAVVEERRGATQVQDIASQFSSAIQGLPDANALHITLEIFLGSMEPTRGIHPISYALPKTNPCFYAFTSTE